MTILTDICIRPGIGEDDGMGLKNVLKQPLVQKFHKEYERTLKASLDTFKDFMSRQNEEEISVNTHMSVDYKDSVNRILKDLIFVQITPGEMIKGAEKVFARYFCDNPQAVVAYCDEYYTENGVVNTNFKPDWSPDTFLSRFYFDGLVVLRKSSFEQEVPEWTKITDKDRWWQVLYDYLKIKDGFNKVKNGAVPVIHIPKVLYNRDWQYNSTLHYRPCTNDNKRTSVIVNTNQLEKCDTCDKHGVTVIIPSKDHPELLEKCISSLKKTVHAIHLQIIVVDNGSCDSNKRIIESLSKDMDFQYIYKEMPFNFSMMCNIGASAANEEHLLFLNDDIECIHNGWLEDMVEVVSRPYVGAVGSKLMYPDGKRIQHAGITNLPIGPVHKLQFLDDETTYYDEYNRGVRNVIAVTGACLLIRREVYMEVGGMSEDLAVAFNDVEFCFKLYEKGYYQAVLQDKPLYHHESLSRGDDESTEKWQRLMDERTTLYSLHSELEGIDPFYNINLNRNGLDVYILPEYMQGKQQMIMAKPELLKGGLVAGARKDSCLLIRVEICKELTDDKKHIELYGYGVVLGSDNSLFAKKLLLRKEDGTLYNIPVKGQYRADLERNMKDVPNVAMSGFWVCFPKADLPEGSYEIGMYAADKTSRTKLYCFTGRIIRKG